MSMLDSENRNSESGNRLSQRIFPVIIPLYVLFFILFSGILTSSTAFWALMSGGIFTITMMCFLFDARQLVLLQLDIRSDTFRKILVGVGMALILYGIFYIGGVLSRQVFPQSSFLIDSIYDLRRDSSPVVLFLILIFVIGPGEELSWRAYVQRHLGSQLKPRYALLISIFLYTFAHIPSGNPMLILAAFVCGLIWGLMYHFFGSVLINIVSHACWDVMVFVLFPL